MDASFSTHTRGTVTHHAQCFNLSKLLIIF